MSSNRPRRLFLHLSALSDDEYPEYLGALRDVLDLDGDDADHRLTNALREEEEEEETLKLEGHEIKMREVRAWMKGRYHDVTPRDIDKVCVDRLLSSHSERH